MIRGLTRGGCGRDQLYPWLLGRGWTGWTVVAVLGPRPFRSARARLESFLCFDRVDAAVFVVDASSL